MFSLLSVVTKKFKLLTILLLMLITITVQANEVLISVKLDGAPEGKKDILQSGLSIVRQQASPQLSERRIQRLHEQAANELIQMLAVYGYYKATIASTLTKADQQWQAHYQIDLGEQVTLSKVIVLLHGEALQDDDFQTLLNDFPLKPGDSFNHENYESAKKSLLRLAAERGYFDGELTEHKVEVDPDNNVANIYLAYNSGPRYVFSDIFFPDTVVHSDLLTRLNPIKKGDPYLASKILKLRTNLTNSGYFKSVAVTTLIDERSDGQVKLAITLDPEAKHRYTAGLGFGTDSGARTSIGWENRYLNKRGHRLNTEAQVSQIANSVAMDYKIPFWSDKISEVGFNSEFKDKDTDSSQSRSFTLGSYYLTERWDWSEIGSLKLLHENFDVSQDDNTSVLLIPGIAWSKTWADNIIYTRRGGKLSLSLSGSSEALLSDTSFVQMVLRGKYIYSVTENGRLITRGTLGATEVTDFTKLPSSLRFFAGGDNSIRGFDFESLGPIGEDGQVNGGRYLAVGSVEYEHMLFGNWGAAIFSDFGNAVDNWRDPFEYSVGVGVRWRSPIGLIRLDIAKGLSDPEDPFGIHFVIGPDL